LNALPPQKRLAFIQRLAGHPCSRRKSIAGRKFMKKLRTIVSVAKPVGGNDRFHEARLFCTGFRPRDVKALALLEGEALQPAGPEEPFKYFFMQGAPLRIRKHGGQG